MISDKEKSIIGSILGTAVGDAMGLCCEGLSRNRLNKMFPDLSGYHFFFNKGMISDDTEHTCLVAQSIIEANGDITKFEKLLGWKFRFWLLGLPAGIGIATLKAIIKLWLGFGTKKSGIFSAGNGPAMRSAIIGVCYADNPELLKQFIKSSTSITHTDPKAEFGAMAVAVAASMASSKVKITPDTYLKRLFEVIPESSDEFISLMNKTINSVNNQQTTSDFAIELELEKGITGYMYHTIPVVIHCWLSNPDGYKKAILEIIHCGGDTDTTAAILGGIIGASVGKEGIPDKWLSNFFEWPRSVFWMERLGEKLAKSLRETDRAEQSPLEISIWGIFIRNIFFMIIVLLHGFRRLLPPY